MAEASRRTTTLIAAATVGVYVLIMAGATTAITDAMAACSGWPLCDGGLLPGAGRTSSSPGHTGSSRLRSADSFSPPA